MTANYYVYYKTLAEAEDVRRAVGALQRLVRERTGVRGRLMRRSDDPATWMEVYESVGDAAAFEHALAAAVDDSGFVRLEVSGGRRHVERFEPA